MIVSPCVVPHEDAVVLLADRKCNSWLISLSIEFSLILDGENCRCKFSFFVLFLRSPDSL